MPEENFFRESKTQQIMLDTLFIYCKLNPDVGYRQGMHELLAPILWVVNKDAIETTSTKSADSFGGDEPQMLNLLDQSFIEHDTFTLYALVMQSAKSFYEMGEPMPQPITTMSPIQEQHGSAPIVSRSKHIHEHYLARVDPELAAHLTEIEILPQIFIM